MNFERAYLEYTTICVVFTEASKQKRTFALNVSGLELTLDAAAALVARLAHLVRDISDFKNIEDEIKYAKLRAAYEAAVTFIDSHAADPDITNEMAHNYAEYKRARSVFEMREPDAVKVKP